MHVADARSGLVNALHHVFLDSLLVGIGVGERIFRQSAQISGRNDVVQILWGLGLILRVLVNGIPQGVQVFLQHPFSSSKPVGCILLLT